MFVDNKVTISFHFYIIHVETVVHFSICQITIFTFIFLPVFLFPIIYLAFYFFPLLNSMSLDHFIFIYIDLLFGVVELFFLFISFIYLFLVFFCSLSSQ